MKKLLLFLLLLIFTKVFSQVTIVPQPADIKMGTGTYNLSANTKIMYGPGAEKQAKYLQDYLKNNYGLNLSTSPHNSKTCGTTTNALLLVYKADAANLDSYQLTITDNKLSIQGNTGAGVFYAIQSLLQLLPANHQLPADKTLSVPALVINDHPRFSYRGMHLDVGRHFFPAAYVKKYIDYLAFNKFNYFHWHLTEDQGWRIEIKRYPRLTSVGGFRNGTIIGHYPGTGNDNQPTGGFYTQKEIKEIVKYAADRFITIIPEIELPGHGSAAIAAYPQLSCFPDQKTDMKENMSDASKKAGGKLVQETWGVFEDVFCPSEFTFNFLQNVLDEVMPLFPSKYIHIGGDECPKEAWKKSAFCQQLIKDKNLKDEHGLQSYFIQRIEKYINGKGKQIIGWDEILEGGLAPNATVMSWRGEAGGIDAAQQNHDVIMTPGSNCYFDHSQTKKEDSVTIGGYLPLDVVYNYEPIPAVLTTSQAKHILGAQGNVWTEYIANTAKLEYTIFPRMSALAEVLWSQKENRNYADFEKSLPTIFKRYDFWNANYSKAALNP